MTISFRLVILCSGIALLLLMVELVRRRRFREELSMTWFLVGLIIMASSYGDVIVDPLARLLGVKYPPALVFSLVIFCLVVTLLYFSAIISDLKGKIKELSQKIALIEYARSREHGKDPD
jgi:hypothetical protein